jgi:ubiquinone/menaquinone biosynthesis C-methylase UbiE
VAEFDSPTRDAWQHPADVIAAMSLKPGMTVVDLGAGTGYFEPWLSKAVGESGTVYALDIEPDMVRYLNERVAREKLSNVRPAVIAMGEPKFPVPSVDRVLIVDTWHHIADRAAYVTKLREGLRDGGQVYVVDFTLEAKHGPPAKHRLSAEQVAAELKSGGFSAQISATHLPEQYIVVGTR